MERNYREFMIARSYAKNKLSNQLVHINEEDIKKELVGKGLEDAQVLFKMMIKEVKAYNSNITKKITLLDNLKHTKDWCNSKLFHGLDIPFKNINRVVKDSPNEDWYDLYKKIVS